MTKNIYISGAEPRSGKSVVALAICELVAGVTPRLGFFRPVISADDESDAMLTLIAERYRLPTPQRVGYGCTHKTARAMISSGRYEDLLTCILERFKVLQAQCDHIICLGTDFSSVTSAFELGFNADIANNLNCLIVPVVDGNARNTEQILSATAVFLRQLDERACDILAVLINRVDPRHLQETKHNLTNALNLKSPIYVLPDDATLNKPTVRDIATALNATSLFDDAEQFNRNVAQLTIAAMELPHFLSHIQADSLIITPGDRADIILGCLMSYSSTAYPQISALLLCGNLTPAPEVLSLMRGLGKIPVAVLSVATDTFTTALHVSRVHAQLDVKNPRKIAAALGLFDQHVNRQDFLSRLSVTRSTRVTPLNFEYDLIQKARSNKSHIVLAEGLEERILRAAEILLLRGAVRLTLLGNPTQVQAKLTELGLHLPDVAIIDPLLSPQRESFAEEYFRLRQHKGISKQMAFDMLADVSYFGTMMVHLGYAQGMVSGAIHTTQHTIRPALEVIKTKPGTTLVSSVFFMCLHDRVLVFGDCAINPDPTAEQLADIALSAATTAAQFGIEPRVAMLSYSSGDSGKGEAVDKVRAATHLVKSARPDLPVEGPIQFDAAIDPAVARTKLPNSTVAGHATVFIFPDLNAGNNTYKAVQRSSGALAIGPVLQGLKKPVNDLSRGCTVADIVNTVAITAIQSVQQT